MIASDRVLDRITAEDVCLAALFTSYSFDPSFFEDHVLRAVLRLSSDPMEEPDRYYDEVRRALQETPVVAIVDAGERQPGRRLPFDLLEVSDVVFHPKLVFLIYRDFARVQIGSGNLTYAGYGGNTELFLCRDFVYDDEIDAKLLVALNEHIERIRKLTRHPGTQLELFQQELERRLPQDSVESRSSSLALLDSTAGPILEQLVALLPTGATIESIGMLAPFFERDDAGFDSESVFTSFVHRLSADAVLDVGVAWNNPEMQDSGESDLEQGIDQLWTWAWDDEGTRTLDYLVPISVGPKLLIYLDEAGKRRRCPIYDVYKEIEDRSLWMQEPPQVFLPSNSLSKAHEHFSDVRMWLHPSTRIVDGQPSHRPLHAKLMTVSYQIGKSGGTLVLMGSPNMSRRALLMRAGTGAGNVELAFVFRVEDVLSLRDVVQELVYVPATLLTLYDRDFPQLDRNWSLAVESAIYDPRSCSLKVVWSSVAAELPGWSLSYEGRCVADSKVAPTEQIKICDFVLNPSTAELVLTVNSRGYPVSILVTDLTALPVNGGSIELGLEELLLLLGHRIEVDRAIKLAKNKVPRVKREGKLDSLDWEGVVPSVVFRAWWSIASDLEVPNLSLQGVRVRLEGTLGVIAAWKSMLDAIEQNVLTSEEVWLYGAELIRTLTYIDLPQAKDRFAKAQLIEEFCTRVHDDMDTLDFKSRGQSWLSSVFNFYGISDT